MIIFLIIFVPILAFWVIFGYICFSNSCKRRKSDNTERDSFCGGKEIPEEAKVILCESRAWLDGAIGEDVYIRSRDGLALHGRLITHEKPLGTVIFAHGYHSSCRRDLAIQAKAVYDGGYNILLMSQRSHGKSEGKYLCFGVKERYDALLWSEFVAKRFSKMPIALMGLSMGGATVMTASALPLPENVRCIVDDCGFTSPLDITVNTLRYGKHIIPYPTVFFMDLWCRILAHYDLWEATSISALKKNTRPLLIFHGEKDTYVPTEMSHRNAQVNPPLTELVIIPEAKHAQSVYYDTDGYILKLLDFLNRNMQN